MSIGLVIIWFVIAAMVAVAVASLLWSLASNTGKMQGQTADAVFYRDQIDEIERDRAKGNLTDQEAEAAKAEAARRLLRVSREHGDAELETDGEPFLRRRRGAVAIVTLLIPLTALVAYGYMGMPQTVGMTQSQLAVEGRKLELQRYIKEHEKYLRGNPADAEAMERLSSAYLMAGRADDSKKTFEKIIALSGENSELLLRRGEALIRMSGSTTTPEMRGLFERAVKLDPKSEKAKLFLAGTLEQEGKRDEAVTLYKAIITGSSSPQITELAQNRVEYLTESLPKLLGNIRALEEKVGQNPQDADAWEELVQSYVFSGRPADADKAFNKAVGILGENAGLLTAYGEAFVRIQGGDVPPEAQSLFERALRKDPNSLIARYYLAFAEEQAGNVAEAVARYKAIVTAAPASPQGRMAQQQINVLTGASSAPQMGDIDSMVAAMADRLDKNGGNVEEWERLIRSYVTLKNKPKAEEALKKARTALREDKDSLARIEQVGREMKLTEVTE